MRVRPLLDGSLNWALVATCLLVLICPLVGIAQESAKPSVEQSSKPSVEEAAVPAPEEAVPAEPPAKAPLVPEIPAPKQAKRPAVVRLHVDGNLAGRVSSLDASGNRVPARAQISFFRNGEVVAVAHSDEQGRFQVTGLEPGVYSVVASGAEGFAAVSVQVLPYAQQAAKEELVLELTLVPGEEADALAGMLMQTPACLAAPAGSACGCCGGGGGGWGLLGVGLGAAGMAVGITALAEEEEASPCRPCR
ncbi:MAG: carboxypeptidase regulatory-like domain-containing protein [Thermoguttaceae bacterium]